MREEGEGQHLCSGGGRIQPNEMSFDADLFCDCHVLSNVGIGILAITDLDDSEARFETLELLNYRSVFRAEVSNPENVQSFDRNV